MQNNLSTIKNIMLLYLPLMYIATGTMLGVFGDGLPYKDWLRLIISIIGIITLIINIKWLTRNKVLRILILMMIIILMSTFSFNFLLNTPTPESVRNLGDSIMWIAVLILAYVIGYKNYDTLYNSRWIALTIPIYYVLFVAVRAYFVLNPEDTALRSTAYYPLLLLPFALMLKRKWLMWILVCIIFLSVVLSSKRAGFIAFIGSLVVYAYSTITVSGRGIGSKIKYLLVFILVGFLGFQIFNNYIASNDITLLERLGTLREDGGSGRDELYAYTLDLLLRSDFISLMFGHGFNTVVHYSEYELSAHTDFLETPFDYGIIGMIVYVVFYFRLYKYYKKLKYYNTNYAPVFLSTMFITLVLSAFAHLIIYPTHFLFFCMYWGFVMGECDRNNNKRCYV